MTAPPLLSLEGIAKRFGRVQALAGAGLAVRAGTVHALLGENGAGKSTLMHVAYGMIRPDAGTIRVAGAPVTFANPRGARAAGIGMVHQHFTSVPAFTVAENVALAAGWAVRPAALRARVRALAERLGLPLDPDARAGDLPVALLQRLEIVKALASEARVLLLDEPTGVLTPPEVDDLLALARRFAGQGGAVVLITHKLDEALRATDEVTVLRRGQVVLARPVAGASARDLASAMVGDATALDEPPPAPAPGDAPVRVRLAGLSVRREDGTAPAVQGAELVVRAGEIVGVAAVEGNGQRELLRAVAGVLPAEGTLEVAAPVSFIAEDRTTEGLVPAFTLTENVALGLGRAAPWVRGPSLDWAAARRRTAALIADYDVRAPGPDARASALSGGNQQKLVVARALERRPAVLVAENPTRGLDLAATRAVHDRLREAAGRGLAVLVHSSDLDEVLALAHRVVVVSRGRVVPVPVGASRQWIGGLMLGVEGALA